MKFFLRRHIYVAIGSSKLRKSAYEVLLASVLTLVLRCFVFAIRYLYVVKQKMARTLQ